MSFNPTLSSVHRCLFEQIM